MTVKLHFRPGCASRPGGPSVRADTLPGGAAPDPDWPAAVPRLLAARFARGIGQGALTVALALYLNALGWSATAIGELLALAMAVAIALTTLVGPLSDRLGRRRFLLVYEGVVIAASVLALATPAAWALVVAVLAAGFGRGANGAAGPFGPLEQAWLAQDLAPMQRSRVFNLNSSLGFAGMALGSLLAALPALFGGLHPGAAAYRTLFLLPLCGSAFGLLMLWHAPESPRARPAASSAGVIEAAEHGARRDENRLLLRLGLANVFNGLGIGLVAPLMAYWFLRRFGHGPGTIGPAFAATFVLAAIGNQVAQRIVPRFGLVRTVIAMRSVSLVLLLLVPLSPLFGLAAAAWALRAAFNQGTIGARQALTMSLTRQHRQGLAATVNNVSVMLPRAVGPALAGLMMHQGWLRAPFVAAMLCQLAYLIAYQRFFGHLGGIAAD